MENTKIWFLNFFIKNTKNEKQKVRQILSKYKEKLLLKDDIEEKNIALK